MAIKKQNKKHYLFLAELRTGLLSRGNFKPNETEARTAVTV
jgi:hypothetical protein